MNNTTSQTPDLLIRIATPEDIPLILEFIHGIGAEVFPDWRVCRMDRSAMEQFTEV